MLFCVFVLSLESISQVEQLDIANFEIGGVGVSHLFFPTSQYLTQCCFRMSPCLLAKYFPTTVCKTEFFDVKFRCALKQHFKEAVLKKHASGSLSTSKDKLSFAPTPNIEIGAGVFCVLGRINSAYSTRAVVSSPVNSGATSRTPFLGTMDFCPDPE